MFGKYPKMVTYRPAGRGQQTRQAIVMPWRLEEFRPWLEELLGPLAVYEVADLPQPPPPHPSAPAPTPPPFAPADGDLPGAEPDDPGWTAEAWHQAGHSEPAPVWWHQDATRDAQPVWPDSG
jgi:hypothetical protein